MHDRRVLDSPYRARSSRFLPFLFEKQILLSFRYLPIIPGAILGKERDHPTDRNKRPRLKIDTVQKRE